VATYYVATYGSNSNNGTSASTPWLTLGFALGAASGTNPGLTAGDTVWVAPGTYRGAVTYGAGNGTAGNTIKIYGDPRFTQAWTSGASGVVRVTSYTSDTTVPTAGNTLAIIGDYIELQDFYLDGNPTGTVPINTPSAAVLFLRGSNLSVTRCVVQSTVTSRQVGINWYCATGAKSLTIDRCTVLAPLSIWCLIASQTTNYNIDCNVKDTFMLSGTTDYALIVENFSTFVTGAKIFNNTMMSQTQGLILFNVGSFGAVTTELRNNIIYAQKGTAVSGNGQTITQTNNYIYAATNYSNISPTTNNVAAPMLDMSGGRMQSINGLPWFAPIAGSPVIGAGTATGAPTVDLYGNTWTGNPTVGAIENKNLGGGLLTHPGMTGGIRG
tara:strand:- start:16 stop:1164 length:1149 start_codon:yes stop_codon:yes gene_type:complete